MPNIISDDVGSFPLPKAIEREDIERIGLELIEGNASDENRERFSNIVKEVMLKKIHTGIERPNYPQVREMTGNFFNLVEKFQTSEPFVIDKKYAKIPEIELLDEFALEFYAKSKKTLELRVCLTGPLELYIKKFGNIVEDDLLKNLAESVSRFAENSIIDKQYLKTKTISIDEPSFGINSNVQFNDEELINAFEIATKLGKRKNMDVQIHLHSPLEMELISQVSSIGIIGIEYAEDPEVLDEIEKSFLDKCDKFLRVGVSRTNIFKMTADYNERFSRDVWKDKNFPKMVERMEPVKKIEKRLITAYEKFGGRIKYAGPDCGLKAWPDQESAFLLLKNSAIAINKFNKSR